ncbi:mediator complex, subunit Med11, partial [Amylocarpus encephaloides]
KMSLPIPTAGDSQAPVNRPFTKAERIQQLNDIDKSVKQLLESVGLALKTLSNTQSSLQTSERQEAFQSSSNTFLKTLQSVDIGLKRQIWGLEEAAIIPADKAKVKTKPSEEQEVRQMGGNRATASSEPLLVEGGMGQLDIGWLNSRSGRVERDMEAELWAKAREFL